MASEKSPFDYGYLPKSALKQKYTDPVLKEPDALNTKIQLLCTQRAKVIEDFATAYVALNLKPGEETEAAVHAFIESIAIYQDYTPVRQENGGFVMRTWFGAKPPLPDERLLDAYKAEAEAANVVTKYAAFTGPNEAADAYRAYCSAHAERVKLEGELG